MEIWKPIPGYEGLYSASNLGNIRSEDRVVRHYSGGPKNMKSRPLKQSKSRHGYLYVGLCKGSSSHKKHPVHRLVLSAFEGPRDRSFDACHNDASRTNNVIENLRWDTRSGNMQDAVKAGKTNRGTKNPSCKLSEVAVRSIRGDGRKQYEIAADFGVGQDVISRIKSGYAWGWVT